MKKILVTNDDGIRSAGLWALLEALQKEENFEVKAVVPKNEKSWIGKAISRGKIKKEKKIWGGMEVYVLDDATPADCTNIGVYNIFPEADLVISGINIGNNAGVARILSSGTIGAAMEAAFAGKPTYASSTYFKPVIRNCVDFLEKEKSTYFEQSAKITIDIVKMTMDSFPKNTDLLSINIPYGAKAGNRPVVTKPSKEGYGPLYHRFIDNVFVYEKPPLEFKKAQDGSDIDEIKKDNVSITPISLNLLSNKGMGNLNNILYKHFG